MAEREVFVRWKFGGDSPEAEVGKAKDAFKDLGTSAKTAGKEASTAFDPATKDLERLELANNKAVAALKRLAETPLGRRLQTEAAQAEIALRQLEVEMNKAGVEGTEMGAKIADGLKKGRAAVEEATTSAAGYRDALGDLKKQGDFAALGAERMAGSFGSASGALSTMADAGKGLTGTLGKVGLGLVGIHEAFKLGYSAGEAFRETVKKLTGVNLDMSESLAKVITGIDVADKKLASYNVTARSTPGIINAVRMALANSIPGLDDYREAFKKTAAQIDLFEAQLGELSRAGQGALNKVVKESWKGILDWADGLKAAGKSLDDLGPKTRRAIELAQAEKAAFEDRAKAAEGYYVKAAAYAAKLIADKEKEAKAASDAATAEIAEIEKQIKALKLRSDTEENYKAKMLALQDKYLEAIQKASRVDQELTDLKEKSLKELGKEYDDVNGKVGDLAKQHDAAAIAADKEKAAQAALKAGIEGNSVAIDKQAKTISNANAARKESEILIKAEGNATTELTNTQEASIENYQKLAELQRIAREEREKQIALEGEHTKLATLYTQVQKEQNDVAERAMENWKKLTGAQQDLNTEQRKTYEETHNVKNAFQELFDTLTFQSPRGGR